MIGQQFNLLKTLTRRDLIGMAACLIAKHDLFYSTTKAVLPGVRDAIARKEDGWEMLDCREDELSMYFCRSGRSLFRMPISKVSRESSSWLITMKLRIIPVVAYRAGQIRGVEEFDAATSPPDFSLDDPDERHICMLVPALSEMLK